MIKKFFLFLPLFLMGEDFITNLEYGEMLYNNPRGIGCIKCHNKDAKGSVIAVYFDDEHNEKKLIAPNIKNVSYETFYHRVKKSEILKNGKYKTINYSAMPKYEYLLDDEIKSIYNYIKAIK